MGAVRIGTVLATGVLLLAPVAETEAEASVGRRGSGGTTAVGAPVLRTSVAALRIAIKVSGPLVRADLPYSWRPGCPVAPWRLRAMTMTYWGFDGLVHRGTLVVRKGAVAAMRTAFTRAFDARFRIRRMVPVDAYYRGGTVCPARSDTLSMNADNTSAFNCRPKTGRRSVSEHSYGLAVDVNPFENPAKAGTRICPAAAAARYYRHRSAHLGDVGVITRRGVLARAMASVGWRWGGLWSAGKDYQHFSRSGR